MNITGAQVKAARELLGWQRLALARKAGLTTAQLEPFESGKARPSVLTVSVLRQILEAAGVEFTNGDGMGVRLRKVPHGA